DILSARLKVAAPHGSSRAIRVRRRRIAVLTCTILLAAVATTLFIRGRSRQSVPDDIPSNAAPIIADELSTMAIPQAWAWSVNDEQGNRIPEAQGSGFDIVLPKTAAADASLTSMVQGNTLEFRGGQIVEVDGVGDFGWKQPFSLAIWMRAIRNDNNHGVLVGK